MNFYVSTGSPVVNWHVMGESSWSVGLRISTRFWAALLLLWRLHCSKCDIVWETMTLWTLAWFPLHGQLGSTRHILFSISFSTADHNPQCRQDYRRDSILDSRYVAPTAWRQRQLQKRLKAARLKTGKIGKSTLEYSRRDDSMSHKWQFSLTNQWCVVFSLHPLSMALLAWWYQKSTRYCIRYYS